jgi:hypothetical protein
VRNRLNSYDFFTKLTLHYTILLRQGEVIMLYPNKDGLWHVASLVETGAN